MIIPRQSCENFLEDYKAALVWIDSLGIKVDQGRTQHYIRVLQSITGFLASRNLNDANDFPSLAYAVFEIPAFTGIHRAFRDIPIDKLAGIIEKLRKGVGGPPNSIEETPEKSSARNFIFEAVVASILHRPDQQSFAMLDAASDTGFIFASRKVWVECKRVSSHEKLRNRVQEACNQLDKVLKKKHGTNNFGLVAVDVTQLVLPKGEMYVTEHQHQLGSSTDAIMDKFIRDYSSEWQRVYQDKNPKILGTLVRISLLTASEQDNLVAQIGQWAVVPKPGLGPSESRYLLHLMSCLQAPMKTY